MSVPPVEKLPLAARKDIRDNWEAKVTETEQAISDLLKEPYKLEVNFNQFYAYGVAAGSSWVKSSPGSAAASYVSGFIYNLKKLTEDGEYSEAIESFNALVSEHKITVEADSSFRYSGCSIKNGVFEINFNPSCPGTNVDYACSDIINAFDKALAEQDENALPLIARRSIRDNYDGKKTDLLARLKEQLLGTEVKLEADYDAIWQTIVAGHKTAKSDVKIENAARNFGGHLFSYFDGLRYQIEYLFKKDDMMVEGFNDAVTTGEVWIEVAPHGTSLKNTYSEIEIKDGKLIMRTVPKYWGTNTGSVANKLVDLL